MTLSVTATSLKPLGDRLVVRPTPREEMTKSGIVLPDTAKERPQEAILSIGPGRTLDDGSREAMDVGWARRSCSRSTPGPSSSWMTRSC